MDLKHCLSKISYILYKSFYMKYSEKADIYKQYNFTVPRRLAIENYKVKLGLLICGSVLRLDSNTTSI